MATFNNGESGSSVRTKINAVLQHTDGTAGELVINEAGADVDFRVESDTNANALFVDGATGNVGVGTSSPAQELEIAGTEPNIRLNSGGTPSALYGFEITNGTAVDAYLRTRGSTGETQLGSGRSAGWGGHLTFYTDTSERMRITAAGNVGIGTSSPTAKLHIVQTDPAIRLTRTTDFFYGQLSADGFSAYTNTNDDAPIIFKTATNERARITSSGAFLVNTTGSPAAGSTYGGFGGERAVFASSGNAALFYSAAAADNGVPISGARGNDGPIAYWFRNGSAVGNISITSSATTYNTSSDYRLKEDVQPMVGASDRVLSLKPVNFAWKADGTRTDGFIAHEVQAVAPQAVTGEKDGEAMQAIDHSKLVPLLTAALQEALAKIATLETRISALEA